LEAINRELTWAHDIGFSKLRVFLHISPYIKNSTQFKKDIFSFLAVAKTRGFHVVFVLFDDCWKSNWMDGDQPDPIPGIHNSQWVQCPGKDDVQESVLQKYVTDIIGTFKNSDTIVMWDLYNEVGNS
jgi:endo-1,4-beta-mannosidase